MKIFLIVLLLCSTLASAQQIVSGKVVAAADSTALPGATVVLKNSANAVTSDERGRFSIPVDGKNSQLVISYIGYKTQMVDLAGAGSLVLVVALEADANQLAEVRISDGYQNLLRERVTGSFSKIDNNLLNRRVSTSIMARLEDAAPGLIFNKGVGAAAGLTIRGQSTISSNARPLIIVDNFPFEGNINSINPNDVESVTVLKDAAASSIWGARAGNGVIVITTRQGGFGQPAKFSFNSNISIGDRPDQYYLPQLSSSEFIELEKSFFAQGRYKSAETNVNKLPFTPVVEILIAGRDGKISGAEAENQIEALKAYDVRRDYDKYLYQKSINRQYALSLQGGSKNQRYFISAGYDKNRDNAAGDGYERITINATNHYQLAGSKLEIGTGIYYTYGKNQQNSLRPLTYTSPLTRFSGMPVYPYARLADQNGNALAVINEYRLAYTEQTRTMGLLDWTYRPLDELRIADNTTKQTEYRLNTQVAYHVLPGLEAQLLYQYAYAGSTGRNLQSLESYYTRSQINKLTIINANGSLTRPVPVGDILDKTDNFSNGHNVRAQLNYSRQWKQGHDLAMIGGAELRSQNAAGATQRLYGYSAAYATSLPVDYTRLFTSFVNPASTSNRILNKDSQSETTDRFLSYYSNLSYTYRQRYSVSASVRYDQSNLFGVNANQKGVPLYSFGGAWNLHEEKFFEAGWLSLLKLRATYGVSGLVNKSLSAYTTAGFSSNEQITGLPYATIRNPPNPHLRWERTKQINIGIDFETRNRILTGSVDVYNKKGDDIIGTLPLAGSSGVKEFTGNYASTSGHGMDIIINTAPFKGSFKWNTTVLFSYVTDKVTDYATKTFATNYINSGNGLSIFPMEGRTLFAYYALDWGGLDPLTGDPQGYLNGEISKDYDAIIGSATAENIRYVGSARPKYFGAVRSTVSWKNLSLTVNATYRLAYYFRRTSVHYSNLLSGYWPIHADYNQRWKNPGDEHFTQVPSMPADINYSRDDFYEFSQALIQRADHIRLQDVNLSYELLKSTFPKLPFSKATLYLYANNLGIIWKKYKSALDPDSPFAAAAPKTFAVGLKLDF